MNGKNKFPVIDHCSDIHFFHPKVSTEHIAETMNSFYSYNSNTKNIDVISIGGDLFDTTVLFSDAQAQEFVRWAIGFLCLCAHYDIEVWIVEGTPRHDRFQSTWLIELNETCKINAPIHYFKGIEYYYSQRIDKHVLFIQDELTTDPDLTYQLAVDTIRNNGLEKVDIISMHGMFDYQAPSNIKIQGVHNSALYQNLVNDFIVIGHVHTPSFHDKIIVAGSATRLKHGEEEPKGHVRIEYTSKHEYRATFIENKEAMIFSDFYITDDDKIEQHLIKRIDTLSYPMGSHVRVVCRQEDNHLFPLSIFSDRRRDYHWTKKELKGNTVINNPIFEELNLAKLDMDIEINQNNVIDVVSGRLSNRYGEDVVDGCITALREVI